MGRGRRRRRTKWRSKQLHKLHNPQSGCCKHHTGKVVTIATQTVEEWQDIALQAFGFKPVVPTVKAEEAPVVPVAAASPVEPDNDPDLPIEEIPVDDIEEYMDAAWML